MATKDKHVERSRRQSHKIRALRNWWFRNTAQAAWGHWYLNQAKALGANKPSDAPAAQ